jgi:hypothetical protein
MDAVVDLVIGFMRVLGHIPFFFDTLFAVA